MNADYTMPTSALFCKIVPDDLRVNLLQNAYAIPKEDATFSWYLKGDSVNEIQTAYRIYIVHRVEDFDKEDYLLDTGWVASDESTKVVLMGLDEILEDNEMYYWAVQIRDRDGLESDLSTPARFTTAIGDDWENTDGIWISDAQGNNDIAFLRTNFKVPNFDNIEKVFLSMTALSPESARQFVYSASLNGNFVGIGPARLGLSSKGKELVYYNTYDITDLLNSDDINALGVICYSAGEKGFLCQITAHYQNGTRRVLLNSARDAESFRGKNGFAAFGLDKSIGTNYYFAPAENFCAKDYPFGFDLPEYYIHEDHEKGAGGDADGEPSQTTENFPWQPVTLIENIFENEDKRGLEPYPAAQVSRFSQEPSEVELSEDGRAFIDFGQEIIGGIRLTLTSYEDDHTVLVRYGEELNPDGTVRYQMRTGNVYEEHWTLKKGMQTFESFGLKTFRYVEILGLNGNFAENDITGLVLRKPFDVSASAFQSTNEVLNKLYDTFKYAIMTTNQDLYVDSQSRERRAYEGDAFINMLSAATYEAEGALPRFTIDYLLTHRTWPAEYILLNIPMVKLDYMFTGNPALLNRVYPQLRTLLTTDHPDATVGLMPQKAEPNNSNDSILVDWPGCARDGYRMNEAYYNTVYNATWVAALNDMTFLAEVVGKEDDINIFRTQADSLSRTMIEKLYDSEKGAFRDGLTREGMPVEHFAQHATAWALWAEVYDSPEMMRAMGQTLVDQGNIRTSIYGAYYLLEGLYKAGFGEYATSLIASDNTAVGAHTWAAALKNGHVTLAPEAWNVQEKGNMTFSHPWGSTPAALLVRGMLGIRPTNRGFRKFEIRPQIGDLSFATIVLPTVRGTIKLSLAQNEEAFEAEVTVPVNTRAEVILPRHPRGANILFINGQKSNIPMQDEKFRIPLGSGTHRLLVQ